jgi:3-methyladenine DNA glycosylase/8-oxoguanine DNA glycosylase
MSDTPGDASAGPATRVASVDLRASVGWYRHGVGDHTTRLAPTSITRATHTPDGPGTIHVDWSEGEPDVRAWGPGGSWLAARARAMVGADAPPVELADAHPVVTRAHRLHPGLRPTASGTLYHELLPTILAQRVTSGEAIRHWRRLCRDFGEPAPGPFEGLRLPPAPELLAVTPAWRLHRLGIEAKRADTLRAVAKVAHHLWTWAGWEPAAAADKLALLRGVGAWTIGAVLGPAMGDTDAVAVGDYHIPSVVACALTGEPRADDARMLELLEPFRPHRGYVIRLLVMSGASAPKFGPRQRILPMSRW